MQKVPPKLKKSSIVPVNLNYFKPVPQVHCKVFVCHPCYMLCTQIIVIGHMGRHIIKYADDSMIVSHVVQHIPPSIKHGKTKNMLIDFGEINIKSRVDEYKWSGYEMTDNHKYLGYWIKISFEANVSVVCKKIQQIKFSFNVCNKMLTLFYKSFIKFIKSGFSFCIVA